MTIGWLVTRARASAASSQPLKDGTVLRGCPCKPSRRRSPAAVDDTDASVPMDGAAVGDADASLWPLLPMGGLLGGSIGMFTFTLGGSIGSPRSP